MDTPEFRFSSFLSDFTQQTLVTILSVGTNLIIALSPTQPPVFILASEFSLIHSPPGNTLIFHFPAQDTPPSVTPSPFPQTVLYKRQYCTLIRHRYRLGYRSPILVCRARQRGTLGRQFGYCNRFPDAIIMRG